jgi:dCMP deaminase
MKYRFINYYMDIAKRTSELSYAKRLQVGAIIVKEDRIISIGFNGTPAGWTNDCEYETISEFGKYLKTKDEVIHAESNAVAKLAKSTESGVGSTMFLTHSPCIHCAKQIYTAGINKVFFAKHYRDNAGIEFLKKCNIEVVEWNIGENI